MPIIIYVIRDGTVVGEFNSSKIISVSYQANSPDIGFSGISTSSISVTLANTSIRTAACQKGDRIVVYGVGLFPDFYVQDRSFDTYTTQFTAYDRCSMLEQEFDNSDFDEYEYIYDQSGEHVINTKVKLYNQTAVISALNTQLGFTVTPPEDIGIKFSKSDLSGTCRSILEAISEINGCMFMCSAYNTIQAVLYKNYIATTNINSYDEVTSDSSYIEFDGLVVNDTTFNKEYHYGSNSIFKYIDSALVKGNSNVGGALFSRFISARYTSFSMTNAIPSYFATGVPQYLSYGSGGGAIALNISAVYTPEGWLVQYSSPECQPSDNTYQSKDQRLIDLALKQGKHGNTYVNKNGSGLVVNLGS